MRGGWFRFFVVPRCFRSHSRSQQPVMSTARRQRFDEDEDEEFEVAEEGEFYSSRIAKMIEKLNNNPGMDKVEFEVESSEVTWSEVSSSEETAGEELAAENVRYFKHLQQLWPGGFFKEWQEGRWEVGEKIAEGGQAELFLLWHKSDDGERDRWPWVIKMFKEGLSVQALETLLPTRMLADEKTRTHGYFGGGSHFISIMGATMFNRKFAILMYRKYWGDLRKLIDTQMIHKHMSGAPFPKKLTGLCMLQIARGMKELHRKNITHGDLKAANVLILRDGRSSAIPTKFYCYVADYECSVGVLGTGFWRAPEILLAVKNRNVTSELFTRASDVYSYGMTCYEILTGRIPFEAEGLRPTDYDSVIGGCRPSFPSKTPHWIKSLLSWCWHENPSERPVFEEIEQILSKWQGYRGRIAIAIE